MIALLWLFFALASLCAFGGDDLSDPLFQAIANSDCVGVQRALRDGATVRSRDEIGATPLMRAVEQNLQPECVQPLIHAGADPNATHGSKDISVLMVAASYSTAETVALLIQSGAKVQFATPDGWTALMSAARNSSQPQVIGTLVAAGANINAVDQYGATPLMRAAQSNPRPEIIEALVEVGADLTAKSPSGHTAYDLAKESGQSERVLGILKLRPSTKLQDGPSGPG